MADLKPIEFPEDLRFHNLSEQELSPLTPQQQALAKDWNVIKRQNEWMISQIVVIYNIMVDHDRILEAWKFWFRLLAILTGGGTGVAALLYAVLELLKK